MYIEDFSFSKADDYGVKHITYMYEENPTKTRQVGFRKIRKVDQPMLSTCGPRCPVKLLKTFLSQRPEELKISGPFYLAVIEARHLKCGISDRGWGIHSFHSFLKSMAVKAEIEG